MVENNIGIVIAGLIILLTSFGYIRNIVKIIRDHEQGLTVKMIFRIIGVFVPFIGVVLGFF
jgi:hypothetical protein